MAIIRSKIARQLLAEGGAPRKGFMFGGPGSEEQQASFGDQAAMNQDDYESLDQEGQAEVDQARFDAGIRSADFSNTQAPSFSENLGTIFKNLETDSKMNRIGRGVLKTPGAIKSAFGFRKVSPELLQTLAEDYTGVIGDQAKNQKGLFSEGLVGGDISLANAAKTFQGLEDLGVDLTKDIRSQVADISRSKFSERFGPKTNISEGGDNEPIKRLRQPIAEKIEEPRQGTFDDILKFYGAKFEDGGEVRQEYGLGSIVKKATRAVKKVAKSPLGKAALIAGFGAYGLGAGPFANVAGSGFLKGPLAKKLFLKDVTKDFALSNLNPFSAITAASLLAGGLSKEDEEEEKLPTVANTDPAFQKYLEFYGGPRRFAESGGDIDEAPMKMASNIENERILENLFEKYLDMGLSPKDAEKAAFDEFERMSKKQGIERTMAAMGGMMNPNDEMLNLGGNEMDLRGGGFVPLGEYEKKDDVPARLSKNEFVMTADAVRAAGGGSVDRGADIMYKTMKTLENKVA
jgi:hypothetical protein